MSKNNFSCICIKLATITFNYTGSPQSYTVPADVGAYSVSVAGGGGGSGALNWSSDPSNPGGSGALVTGIMVVNPGSTLTILVGGKGSWGGTDAGNTNGGFPGGGPGAYGSNPGGGGGGLSAIQSGSTYLVIAGGGGGGAYYGAGGDSGFNGLNGSGQGYASGGTQTAGGFCTQSGGIGYGTQYQGGQGTVGNAQPGGGGGGGLWGGGGGGNSGGGGGGSSYVYGINHHTVTTGGGAGSDTNGVIYLTPVSRSLACFTETSKLLTPSGYKVVKAIETGDLLMTADGRKVPVIAYSQTIKGTKESAPFLIPKNSLGAGYPAADLRLSPWHGIQIKKGLWMKPMSAFELGLPVEQYDVGKPVTYYHFEAPNYFKDNFICEGTVVESFGGEQTAGMKPNSVYKYNPNFKAYTRVVSKPNVKISNH